MEGKITSFDEKTKTGYILGDDKSKYSFKKSDIGDVKRKINAGNFVTFERKVTPVSKSAINIKMHKTFTGKKISEHFHMRNTKPTGRIERYFKITTAQYPTKKEVKKALIEIANKLNCNAIYDMELKSAKVLNEGKEIVAYQLLAKVAIVTTEKPCFTAKEEDQLNVILQDTILEAEKVYDQMLGKGNSSNTNISQKKDKTMILAIGLSLFLLVGIGVLAYMIFLK
jgi:lipopolysaccharide biosynthesis glycosyltransferase